jgi:uncharacterized protein (TIRG00374 family)
MPSSADSLAHTHDTVRSPEISVVLPAYNEAETIRKTVAVTLETLSESYSVDLFEVLIAEDGCSDDTPAIADRLAESHTSVRHIHSDTRLGRGGALERAFSAAHGSVLVYFDTDLSTDMQHLPSLINHIRNGDADVATGSRWISGHTADRPRKRMVPSRIYNSLVRLFLQSELRDHQCGFKALSREAFETLSPIVEDAHWFWDTEILVRAQRHGFTVTEFPVKWTPKGDTKVDLIRDVLGMGSQIFRTWWQVSIRPRLTQRVSVAAGGILALFALVLMTQYIDFATVFEEMQAANIRIIGIAGGVYLLSWPLRGIRYRDILSELGYRERVSFLTGAVFISQTGNLVFPARAGDLVRAYVVKMRRGIPYPTGIASLAAERVFDLLTITALGGIVLLEFTATGRTATLAEAVLGAERAGRIAVLVACGVALVAVTSVVAIALSARSEHNLIRTAIYRFSTDSYATLVADVLSRFIIDLQRAAGTRSGFMRIGVNSLLIWSIDVLTALLVLLAFDPGISTGQLVAVSFFAVSVGNLAKVLPLSPGGIGLYEGAFTLLVVALTPLGPGLAIGAAVIDHTVKNILTVIGGYSSMIILNVSLTNAVEETKQLDTGDETVSPE